MPFYAVRGGRKEGVYVEWCDAVNAGWFQRQPFGNAVKLDNFDDALKFISFPGDERRWDVSIFCLFIQDHIESQFPL